MEFCLLVRRPTKGKRHEAEPRAYDGVNGRNNSNNTHFQFWQQDNHPIELVSNEMLDQRIDYIHENPVKAGFVYRPEDYPWSSAQDYAGIKGPIDIQAIS